MMMNAFTFLPTERVIYGPGSISALVEELQRLDATRVLIITGRTVFAETPIVRQVISSLGDRHAGVFTDIRQHAPRSDIQRAAAVAREGSVDLLLSVGGGSAIDAAKAVAWELGVENAITHVAVPTTLSAAEFSHIAGFTVEDGGRSKDRVRHPALTPRLVILDAELTAHTPPWLWASTGIRALDHAVETLVAAGDHPIPSLLALEAIRELFACLPASWKQPHAADLRHRCQLAAWMSNFAPATVQMGLSHAISKSFATNYEVPHGISSCITLPPTMRHMAIVRPQPLARMARELNVAAPHTPDLRAALFAADAVADLIRRFDLPTRLRDVGVPREAIAHIAQDAVGSSDQQAAAVRILQEAW